MPGASRTIVINAPVEKVFAVVTDFEKYKEFLPEVKSARVRNCVAGSCEVDFEVEVIKSIRYSIRVKEAAPHRMEWSFISGDFMKDNAGGWVLEDMGGGQTRATYTVEMKLGALVPGAVVKGLVETSLPKTLESFKNRSERG